MTDDSMSLGDIVLNLRAVSVALCDSGVGLFQRVDELANELEITTAALAMELSESKGIAYQAANDAYVAGYRQAVLDTKGEE